jgi:hypothetical protein
MEQLVGDDITPLKAVGIEERITQVRFRVDDLPLPLIGQYGVGCAPAVLLADLFGFRDGRRRLENR